MEAFYSQLAGISFTLLGLWWVVVQFKYERWMATAGRRVTAYATSANFIAVGVLALLSVPNVEAPQIWRLGAGVGAVLGILVTIYALASGALTRGQRISELLILLGFVLVGVLSFVGGPLMGVRTIVIEAVIEVAVLVLSIHVVWQFFTDATS